MCFGTLRPTERKNIEKNIMQTANWKHFNRGSYNMTPTQTTHATIFIGTSLKKKTATFLASSLILAKWIPKGGP